ncbi:erythromycin esterase family protein [Paenibacillus sp. S-12]|uniref:erythromycin esterase family protein n=1 Tax=Paenibacillus sp. S-12 TaxID=3031371 RepID=UPI0025A0F207|nr:erythromycin esterase family protein [Paenibacillus sp. S-12]
MRTFTTNWKRKSIHVLFASVIALGTMLSWQPVAYGQSAPAASMDAQNKTISGSTSNQFTEEWHQWIKNNAYALESILPEQTKNGLIASDRFKDLDMLKPLLSDKRIVYLGESSHGVGEFNSVKARLIQFLHQELGFNVVAFESPLGNAATAFGSAKTSTANQLMKKSVFPQWWAKETTPLFQYIQESQSTDNPIQLTGFDMQSLGPFLNGEVLKDQDLAKRLAETEKKLFQWGNTDDLAAYSAIKPDLQKLYKDVKGKIATNENQLKKMYPDNPHIVAMVNRTLDDRLRVVDEYIELSIKANVAAQAGDYAVMTKMMEWRDKAMADNLLWLATEIYPMEKIIVWGHNAHISKAESKMEQSFMPVAGRFMGEIMQDSIFGPYSYTIGLYAGSGTTHDNMGEPLAIQPLPASSIESIMKAANRPYSFVDLRYAMKGSGTSWMDEPRTALYFGLLPEVFVPREQYDGILYIDKVQPPTTTN